MVVQIIDHCIEQGIQFVALFRKTNSDHVPDIVGSLGYNLLYIVTILGYNLLYIVASLGYNLFYIVASLGYNLLYIVASLGYNLLEDIEI